MSIQAIIILYSALFSLLLGFCSAAYGYAKELHDPMYWFGFMVDFAKYVKSTIAFHITIALTGGAVCLYSLQAAMRALV